MQHGGRSIILISAVGTEKLEVSKSVRWIEINAGHSYKMLQMQWLHVTI